MVLLHHMSPLTLYMYCTIWPLYSAVRRNASATVGLLIVYHYIYITYTDAGLQGVQGVQICALGLPSRRCLTRTRKKDRAPGEMGDVEGYIE